MVEIKKIQIWMLILLISELYASSSKQVAGIYSNDRSIEYRTNIMTQNTIYHKEKCTNQHSYPYLIIDSGQTIYSAIIVCNVHARQLIATQICLNWLQSLSLKPEITNKMKFTVFYRANRMRDQARTQEGECKRKNQNGVDLNRNFPTEFNFYNAKPKQQIYPSDRPINQPFTICLNQIIEKHKPHFFLDIHSGQRAFYYQEGINNQQELQILNTLNQTVPQVNITKITTLKKDGQSINGHIFADLKVRKQVPYSFLFQVYSGKDENQEKDSPDRCFKMFNPSTKQQMHNETQIWTDAIMTTVSQVLLSLDKNQKI